MIDSCREIGNVECGEGILKLIRVKLTESSAEKEKIFFKRSEIQILRTTGNLYREASNLSKAMEYYQLSRSKAEETRDSIGLAAALLNIGNVYTDLSNYSKALEYQYKSLKIFKQIGDKRGIGICLNNIGSSHKNQSNNYKALDYFRLSLKIQSEREDTFEIMTCLNNMATVYELLKEFSEATKYYQEGLSFAKKIGDTDGTINSLAGIANILTATGKQREAEQYYNEALQLSVESENISSQSKILGALSEVYKKQGKYKEALAMYDDHIVLKDSIFSQEQAQDISRRDAKYESDKRETLLKEKQEEDKRVAAIIIWSVASGLLLVIVFSVFVYRSLRVTRKQKHVIEKQNELVEEKQKEILASITYAKRLQDAILPPPDFIKQHLPDNFILYKPKDVVAGDFYWMEVVDDYIFIAAADSTGHGVPGAMVSVVCSNALNRSVKEFGLRDTGKILDKVTDLVLETFEKSISDVKDGMDISLLAFHKPSRRIQWSGANNPLWYFAEGEFKEIKANKQPIGKYDNRQPFTAQNIEYSDNAIFYLFTDGYADQFGGPKGKKFKYKQLEEILHSIHNKNLEEQKKILGEIFESWRENVEQVDDVCIIGIQMP